MTLLRAKFGWLALVAASAAGVLATDRVHEPGRARAAVLALPSAGDARPFWLSETGLYADIASKRIAAGNIEYQPAYELWSDGAHKRRWLRLPPETRIDTSDMDHWQFPIGTQLWKEFSREGRRVETRLIARTGPRPEDYWVGAFVWNEDESDARFAPDGARDARATPHDVPSTKNCYTCHNGEPGRVLGFSAVQQPEARADMLTRAPPRAFHPPGEPAAAAALGYLHANCGHCHNPRGSARPDTDLSLRLSWTDRRAEDTAAFRTAVGQPLRSYVRAREQLRIARGSAADSGVWRRMVERAPVARMPPLGTEELDPVGVEHVKAFIDAL